MSRKNDKLGMLLKEACQNPQGEADFMQRVQQRIEHQKRLASQRERKSWQQAVLAFIQSSVVLVLLLLGFVLAFQDSFQKLLYSLFPQLQESSWLLLPICGVAASLTLICFFHELREE